MSYIEKIEESVKYIKNRISIKPEIGLVLGSGLGDLAEKIKDSIILKYKDIPNFPESTVEGHKGQLIVGTLGDKQVIAMQGRFHYYEGYTLKEITFPIRCMIGLGIDNLIVTNAAGGVNSTFKPGDLMIIKDHINFTGNNPLIGENLDEKGPRFVDMTFAYNKDLMDIAIRSGKNLNIDLKTGIYMCFTGPTYETPAEVRMANVMGADAVGMSTVPEVIVANHEGIKVLGISCITNMASGILNKPLNHEEVVETSMKVKNEFENLIIDIIKNI
ncbi:purine-nucleoside phosphorylase [Paratissierella segnis]|uniref:Purine nucleoside phosphorylase n=1 Tax=Paratissierella segnis TaxID=2763679 RepID=A0A926IKE7_9FIRM|nr:purine-nucleoside phosphorylase [Paratissierella segnis]MBC8588406.1 purine-nucleoside phosphorylase [Paratissierella segnis]